MSEALRTILAVAVLTAAIWVWADLEVPGDREEAVPVQVVVPADYIVRSLTPSRVTVKYNGPRGQIQELKDTPEELACRFELTDDQLRSAARLVLHVRDGFRHWASRRIQVVDARSEHDGLVDGDIILTVDHRIRQKVRVEPRVSGAVPTAVTADPAEVVARVFESEWKTLPEAKRYVVAPLVVGSVASGSQMEREVTLERKVGGPDGIEAEGLEPPIVKVTARLESALLTKSLGRFPILISAPPEILNRYRLVFQPEAERSVELEVQGPAPDVERLSPQDIRVQLILTADDKPDPASWLPGKPVVTGLPPGVKLTKPLPTINFNLEKQPAGDKPPTP